MAKKKTAFRRKLKPTPVSVAKEAAKNLNKPYRVVVRELTAKGYGHEGRGGIVPWTTSTLSTFLTEHGMRRTQPYEKGSAREKPQVRLNGATSGGRPAVKLAAAAAVLKLDGIPPRERIATALEILEAGAN